VDPFGAERPQLLLGLAGALSVADGDDLDSQRDARLDCAGEVRAGSGVAGVPPMGSAFVFAEGLFSPADRGR